MNDEAERKKRFVFAATMLAVVVTTQHRIATEPDYAADRSPWADRKRAEHLEERIREFREAQEAWDRQ